MNYHTLAEQYINKCEKIYHHRINNQVRDFVRGFAYYLTTHAGDIDSNGFKHQGIALITENTNHVAGGRYYAWMMAHALVEAGYKVTVYTTRKPTFEEYFADYKPFETVVIPGGLEALLHLDIEADAYIGSPIRGCQAAIRLGQKYNKPSYPMMFDPFPMMKEYLGKDEYPGWDEYIRELRNADTKILTLCRSLHPYCHDWLNKTDDQLIPLYPSINSAEKKKATKPKRGDYVLFISRLVGNKMFNHVLGACKNNRVNLKVISSVASIDKNQAVRMAGMMDRVEFIQHPSDVEKFELIYGARAVINGAVFEGFGVWLAEAITCGTPAVCYHYPTFSEIVLHAKADNVYFAEHNSKNDLSKKLTQCLREEKYRDDNDAFDFGAMVKRVKQIFKDIPCTPEN